VGKSADINIQGVRRAALLVLWIAAVALWAVVFFRAQPAGKAPHLPTLGSSPPAVTASPAARLPGQLQAEPGGPGATGRGRARHTGGPTPVDAEDIAEGDVEDEPAVAVAGVTGPITGNGSAPGTAILHSTVPIPALPVSSPIPKLP
jgi:hypothetical protein